VTVVLSLIVLALFCFHASAQAVIVLTPQIGVNASRLTSDPEGAENSMRPGWQAGGYLRLGQDNLYLQPGIFWYRISTQLETKESLQESQVFGNTIDSIQIPLMVGFHVINTGRFNLRLQLGAAADIITGVDENPRISKEDLNDMNWLLKAAVGVDIAIVTLDLGYDKGISNYFKDDADNTGKMDSIVFNVGLGFWI
jgi:hypothetical protein